MISEIDKYVLDLRSNRTSHDFEDITIEGVSRRHCKRCGKHVDAVKKEDGSYQPCRGFV